MRRIEFNARDQSRCIWFLDQLDGLAEAVQHIHNLPITEATILAASLTIPGQETRKAGWHHDLKPENILFFKEHDSRYGRLKITDFGSGKVHTYRSGSKNTGSGKGTLTYEAPEAVSEGVFSRPYDIWSLGCVFLELLVWAVYDYQSVMNFTGDRMARGSPGTQFDLVEDDRFWQRTEGGKFIIRQSVMAWIQQLKQEEHHYHDVLNVIVFMLEPDQEKRINAIDLCNSLEEIYKKKKLVFENLKEGSYKESSQDPLLVFPNQYDRRASESVIPFIVLHFPPGHTDNEAITRQADLGFRNCLAPGLNDTSPNSPPTIYQSSGCAKTDVDPRGTLRQQNDINLIVGQQEPPHDQVIGKKRLYCTSEVRVLFKRLCPVGILSSRLSISYVVHWELPGFLKAFFSDDVKLGDVMTLTGAETEAYAVACRTYLKEAWPLISDILLQALEDFLLPASLAFIKVSHGMLLFISSLSFHCISVKKAETLSLTECDATDEDSRSGYPTISITNIPNQSSEGKIGDSSYTSAANFAILATVDEHVHIASALKWLCAAIRHSPSESLSLSEAHIIESSSLLSPFTIEMAPLTAIKETSCWHNLFLNTVIAQGFSIPSRTDGKGLEISFSDMVKLSRTLRLVEYDRGTVAEGAQNLLVPVKRLSNDGGIQWHLEGKWSKHTLKGRRKKITAAEILTRMPFKNCLRNLEIEALKTERNFLGWTDSALISLGTSQISSSMDFSSSGASRPHQEKTRVSSYNFGLGLSHWGGATFGVTATTSSIASRFSRDTKKDLEDTLQDAGKESIVLYDYNEKTAWHIAKPSVILFMAQLLCEYRHIRAYHHDGETPVPVPIASRSTNGSQAALEAIRSSFQLKLEKGKNQVGTFAGLLELICLGLEIAQQHASGAWDNAVKHKKAAPKGIVGFEMMEIIKESPVLNVKEERVDQPWSHIAQDGGLVLFVKDLGQAIVPANPGALCKNWQQVPSGRNYLAAGSLGLSHVLMDFARSRLSDRLEWDFSHPTNHSESCMVSRCRRVQFLRSAEKRIEQPGLWDALCQYKDGAFIFDQKESVIKRFSALILPRSEHKVTVPTSSPI